MVDPIVPTVLQIMRGQRATQPVMTVRQAVRGNLPDDFLHRILRRRSLPGGQEAQRLRTAWADSQERTAANRVLSISAVLYGVIAIGMAISLYLWDASQSDSSFSSPPRPWWLYGLLAIVALASAWAYYRSITIERAMQQLDDRLALDRIQGAEAEAAADEETLSLPVLWALTQQRIDHYHRLATGQSSTSFRTGQIIMIAGFVAVIALGALAAFASNGTAAIAASVVAVAGAALSGFVGATFMKSQSEASVQLREFFLQPVEFARLLGAERLVQLLADDAAKGRAIEQIIKDMAQPRVDRSTKSG